MILQKQIHKTNGSNKQSSTRPLHWGPLLHPQQPLLLLLLLQQLLLLWCWVLGFFCLIFLLQCKY